MPAVCEIIYFCWFSWKITFSLALKEQMWQLKKKYLDPMHYSQAVYRMALAQTSSIAEHFKWSYIPTWLRKKIMLWNHWNITSSTTGSGLTVRRGSEPALNVLDDDSSTKPANKQTSKSQGDLILKDQVSLLNFLTKLLLKAGHSLDISEDLASFRVFRKLGFFENTDSLVKPLVLYTKIVF